MSEPTSAADTGSIPEPIGDVDPELAAGHPMSLEFCGEWYYPSPDGEFVIGRGDDADLDIDDNPYLHRKFLTVTSRDGSWWLNNVGATLSATIANGVGTVQAWLAPGASLPFVFDRTNIMFTAASTTYELQAILRAPQYVVLAGPNEIGIGETTIAPMTLTTSQKQLIVALAEPMLRRDGVSISSLPSSAKAAARLGWTITKFNRKLDNVCDKLDRHGVTGVRAGGGKLALNRKARLVEHSVSTRLVTSADLPLLDIRDAE